MAGQHACPALLGVTAADRQALFLLEPGNQLVIGAPALAFQQLVQPTIAIASVFAGQCPKPLAHSGPLFGPNRLPIRLRSRDAHQPARPTSRQAVLVLSQSHRFPSGCRRYQFFPEALLAPCCPTAPRPSAPSDGDFRPPATSAALRPTASSRRTWSVISRMSSARRCAAGKARRASPQIRTPVRSR